MTSGPKIVHIETRYVETDAINFRDVVQRLTGKNSSTTNWVGNGASSSVASSSDYNKRGIANDGASANPQEGTTANTEGIYSTRLRQVIYKFPVLPE
ncbi:Modulating plastid sigma factor [Spatholobus suberectus]|nr:Modulating plastid sigma factor [Spatholobus suberectus]